HHLAHKDYLSGLLNHGSFQERFRSRLEQNQCFNLLIGDIDDFKKVNDEYGHLTGDDLTRKAGDVFRIHAEAYNGQAFRYGGEEFVFILPYMEDSILERFLYVLYDRLKELE
ncbi:GGDEF domain-containing protein, partial [Micrococcus sp. SIMBA_144]